MFFVIFFLVEPRVITLLAHCRELQPTRRISMSSIQKRYSIGYSKDDQRLTYSSSFSDLQTTTATAMPRSSKFPSESDVSDLVNNGKELTRLDDNADTTSKQRKGIGRSDDRKSLTSELISVLTTDNTETATETQPIVVSVVPPKRNSDGIRKQSSIILEEEEIALMETTQFSKGQCEFF